MLAHLVDAALSAYGRLVPYHGGRWRITNFLGPYTASTWKGPREITRMGIRLAADPSDFVGREILYNHEYEPYETRFIRSVIRPGFTVADAGAHIGWFTLHFSSLVGPDGSVLSFEPCASTREQLEHNLALNSANNVTVYPIALGDHADSVQIRCLNAGNIGQNRVGLEHGDIPMTTLDSFNLSRLDFLKVDVEGCEVRVLRGGAKSIEKFRPMMLIELNPDALRDFGDSSQGVLDLLHQWGYRITTPTRHGLQELHTPPEGKGVWLNIIAKP